MNNQNLEDSFGSDIKKALGGSSVPNHRLRKVRKMVLSEIQPESSKLQAMTVMSGYRLAAAIMMMLFLVLIGVGPRNVFASLGDIIANIPGIGLVKDEEVGRILSGPVTISQGGIILTVEQLYVTDEKSQLSYSVSYENMNPQLNSEGETLCRDHPTLRISRKTVLSPGESFGGGGKESQNFLVEYENIPPGKNHVIFQADCLYGLPQGTIEDLWSLDLELVPGETVVEKPEIITLPTATPHPTEKILQEETPTVENSMESLNPTPDPDAIWLTMDKIIPLEEGFILYTSVHWDNPEFDNVYPLNTRLVDGYGVELPHVSIHPDLEAVYSEEEISQLDWFPMALQVQTAQQPTQLTLTMDGARVDLLLNEDIVFDIGDNPYGGPWEINKEILVAGKSLTILTVDAVTIDNHPGYDVLIETNGDFYMPELLDNHHPTLGGGGGPRGETVVSAFILYDDGWPFGENALTLASIRMILDGEWESSWEAQVD